MDLIHTPRTILRMSLYILLSIMIAGVAEAHTVTNVVDYGANGSDTINDTAAINSAIAVANSKGGTLFFPEGTYYITPGGLNTITSDVLAPTATFKLTSNAESYTFK